MFSVAPNIVLAPNMTQNAERKHRTQDANTAPIRPRASVIGGSKTNLQDVLWECNRLVPRVTTLQL